MTSGLSTGSGPHQGQPLHRVGELRRPRAACVIVHGRGGSATDILGLSRLLPRDGVLFLAPQAAGNTWYPHRFIVPWEDNEPGITSGLTAIADALAAALASGVTPERTMLVGFSQGACLVSEFVARHATRYGGVCVFTGGVIGDDDQPRHYAGDLAGTPSFLASGDPDPHVPWERVELTADIFRRLGADLTLRRYPGRPHTISQEEVDHAAAMLKRLTGQLR
jgi:predicted esterase